MRPHSILTSIFFSVFMSAAFSATNSVDPRIFGTWVKLGYQTSTSFIPADSASYFTLSNDLTYWSYDQHHGRSLVSTGRISIDSDNRILLMSDSGFLTLLGTMQVENDILIRQSDPSASSWLWARRSNSNDRSNSKVQVSSEPMPKKDSYFTRMPIIQSDASRFLSRPYIPNDDKNYTIRSMQQMIRTQGRLIPDSEE